MSQSIAEALLEATQILGREGVPEGRREASSLLANVLGQDRSFLIIHAGDLLCAGDLETFRAQIDRRASGEPLQYITGRQEFFGLDFEVNGDVLIPRPETEVLVETALDLIGRAQAKTRICDIGTGSGCIVIALLHKLQTARAVAVDISANALRVAARNATRHGVTERISFAVADCFTAFRESGTAFDILVSNPPYVAKKDLTGLQREVRDHEPLVALTSGEDGLTVIRRLLRDTPQFLINQGHLVMEIGFDQRAAVEELIDRQIWKLLDVRSDLQGIPRTVVLQKVAL